MNLRTLLTAPLASQQNLVFALLVRSVVVFSAIAVFVLGFQNLYFGEYGKWVEVPAKVVDNATHSSNPTIYTPIVTYTYNGHEYQTEGFTATKKPYPIGNEVTILINPTDPSKTFQRSNPKIWLLIMFGVLILPILKVAVTTAIELIGILRSRKITP